jgi:hypothetical protein
MRIIAPAVFALFNPFRMWWRRNSKSASENAAAFSGKDDFTVFVGVWHPTIIRRVGQFRFSEQKTMR